MTWVYLVELELSNKYQKAGFRRIQLDVRRKEDYVSSHFQLATSILYRFHMRLRNYRTLQLKQALAMS